MSQNYNYSNGIVGKWHGLPVYVIKESEFFNRRFSPEATTIYALSKGDNGDLELVLKDTLIGTMTSDGTVSDCNPPMPFERFPSKSKGKGTAGVIKRWNFHRLKETHGTGPCVRHGGSIGACSSPSRVWKGKRMAGHLGAEQVTVQNLTVVKVDAENNLIAVKGAVPGPNKGIVVLKDSVKA